MAERMFSAVDRRRAGLVSTGPVARWEVGTVDMSARGSEVRSMRGGVWTGEGGGDGDGMVSNLREGVGQDFRTRNGRRV
jgi:hypothetical protein